MTKDYLVVITVLCCWSSGALALDASELASLKDTVREMCLHPDRTGDFLKTEGEAKVGAPVLFKIINGELSGKLSYEKWNGISITADKYKTDPRECAIELLKILQPVLSSPKGSVTQSSSGTASPNVGENKGNININVDGRSDGK
jgi:hypothetical protein